MRFIFIKPRPVFFAAFFILICSGAFADVDPSTASSESADKAADSALGQFRAETSPAPFMPFPFPTYAPMPYDFNSVFQAYINALQSYTQNLQSLQQQFSTQQNQNQNQIAARYAADRYCILAKN